MTVVKKITFTKLDTNKMNAKRFLATAEVARLFEVSPNTVARWARQGKLPCLTTPSGRRKFPRAETEQLLERREAMPVSTSRNFQ